MRVPFADVPPGALIELVEPIDESSPVTCFTEGARDGLYHLCYEADEIESRPLGGLNSEGST